MFPYRAPWAFWALPRSRSWDLRPSHTLPPWQCRPGSRTLLSEVVQTNSFQSSINNNNAPPIGLVVPVCHNLYISCDRGHLQERIWVQICCHWVLWVDADRRSRGGWCGPWSSWCRPRWTCCWGRRPRWSRSAARCRWASSPARAWRSSRGGNPRRRGTCPAWSAPGCCSGDPAEDDQRGLQTHIYNWFFSHSYIIHSSSTYCICNSAYCHVHNFLTSYITFTNAKTKLGNKTFTRLSLHTFNCRSRKPGNVLVREAVRVGDQLGQATYYRIWIKPWSSRAGGRLLWLPRPDPQMIAIFGRCFVLPRI